MPNWAKWKNFISMDDAISMEQVITPTMEFASFASIFSDRPTPPIKRQDSSIPAVTKPSIKETRSNTIAPGSVKTGTPYSNRLPGRAVADKHAEKIIPDNTLKFVYRN